MIARGQYQVTDNQQGREDARDGAVGGSETIPLQDLSKKPAERGPAEVPTDTLVDVHFKTSATAKGLEEGEKSVLYKPFGIEEEGAVEFQSTPLAPAVRDSYYGPQLGE